MSLVGATGNCLHEPLSRALPTEHAHLTPADRQPNVRDVGAYSEGFSPNKDSSTYPDIDRPGVRSGVRFDNAETDLGTGVHSLRSAANIVAQDVSVITLRRRLVGLNTGAPPFGCSDRGRSWGAHTARRAPVLADYAIENHWP